MCSSNCNLIVFLNCGQVRDKCMPSFRSSAGERRLEIMSGKVFTRNQMYSSPDMTTISTRVNRLSQVASSPPLKPWVFNDPGMKRKKSIAKYKFTPLKTDSKLLSGVGFVGSRTSALSSSMTIDLHFSSFFVSYFCHFLLLEILERRLALIKRVFNMEARASISKQVKQNLHHIIVDRSICSCNHL